MKLRRKTFHVWVLRFAGIYNLGWGLISTVHPQWLFSYAHMPLQNYPEIFQCLAMVVGLYGFIYLEAARVPERGWRLVAVGLLGKVLGPIGMVVLVLNGKWPASASILCLLNDVIWWIPFGIYLYDAWPFFNETEWGKFC